MGIVGGTKGLVVACVGTSVERMADGASVAGGQASTEVDLSDSSMKFVVVLDDPERRRRRRRRMNHIVADTAMMVSTTAPATTPIVEPSSEDFAVDDAGDVEGLTAGVETVREVPTPCGSVEIDDVRTYRADAGRRPGQTEERGSRCGRGRRKDGGGRQRDSRGPKRRLARDLAHRRGRGRCRERRRLPLRESVSALILANTPQRSGQDRRRLHDDQPELDDIAQTLRARWSQTRIHLHDDCVLARRIELRRRVGESVVDDGRVGTRRAGYRCADAVDRDKRRGTFDVRSSQRNSERTSYEALRPVESDGRA